MIKVKTEVVEVKPNQENSVFIDGASTMRLFSGYHFLNKTKFDLMTMQEIMELEKGKERASGALTQTENNPKKAIRDMVEASKQRKAREVENDEALFAES